MSAHQLPTQKIDDIEVSTIGAGTIDFAGAYFNVLPELAKNTMWVLGQSEDHSD